MDSLCLSIDTHVPEIFEKIRQRANVDKVFQNFEATAERCKEHNLECIVNVVLMMENVALMPETLGYFADHGYDHVNVMQMLDINNESSFHDPLAHFSEEFLLRVKVQCIEVCRKRRMRMLWNVGTLEIIDFRDDHILPDPRKQENDHFDWRMQRHLPGFCRHAQIFAEACIAKTCRVFARIVAFELRREWLKTCPLQKRSLKP